MEQKINLSPLFFYRYLICVNTHMKDLKPFGDVPKKLSVQVKRSFVATRTFTQALNVGRDVVSKMQSVYIDIFKHLIKKGNKFDFLFQLEASSECARAVMRLTGCPLCQGFSDVRPCPNFCLNVFKGCLAYHADLGLDWDNYIGIYKIYLFLEIDPYLIISPYRCSDESGWSVIGSFQYWARRRSDRYQNLGRYNEFSGERLWNLPKSNNIRNSWNSSKKILNIIIIIRCLKDAGSQDSGSGAHLRRRQRSISRAWNLIGVVAVEGRPLLPPAGAVASTSGQRRQLERHSIASFATLNRRWINSPPPLHLRVCSPTTTIFFFLRGAYLSSLFRASARHLRILSSSRKNPFLCVVPLII